MTKAKARLRAKAKAAQKSKKRKAGADDAGRAIRSEGHFDPGASSKRSFGLDANTKNFAGARRGGARSR